jgi:hypothetical protein
MVQKDPGRDDVPRSTPSTAALWTSGILAAAMMLFSIVMWVLGNESLAGYAGTGAILLVGDIARRLLGIGMPDSTISSSYEKNTYKDDAVQNTAATALPSPVIPPAPAPAPDSAPPAMPQQASPPPAVPSAESGEAA